MPRRAAPCRCIPYHHACHHVGRMDARVRRYPGRRTGGRTNGCTDGRAGARTHVWTGGGWGLQLIAAAWGQVQGAAAQPFTKRLAFANAPSFEVRWKFVRYRIRTRRVRARWCVWGALVLANAHARMHARTHARTRTRTHARTHPPMHTCTHPLAHPRTHAPTHACMRARKYARMQAGG